MGVGLACERCGLPREHPRVRESREGAPRVRERVRERVHVVAVCRGALAGANVQKVSRYDRDGAWVLSNQKPS